MSLHEGITRRELQRSYGPKPAPLGVTDGGLAPILFRYESPGSADASGAAFRPDDER